MAPGTGERVCTLQRESYVTGAQNKMRYWLVVRLTVAVYRYVGTVDEFVAFLSAQECVILA